MTPCYRRKTVAIAPKVRQLLDRVEEATEPLALSTNSLKSCDDNPEPKTLNDLVLNNPRMLFHYDNPVQMRGRRRGNLTSAASTRSA